MFFNNNEIKTPRLFLFFIHFYYIPNNNMFFIMKIMIISNSVNVVCVYVSEELNKINTILYICF